jgi:hypothetical protein
MAAAERPAPPPQRGPARGALPRPGTPRPLPCPRPCDSRALSLRAQPLSLRAQPVKLQRILEGVAVLFGTDDRTWAATRRMCFEGHLVQLMLRYDFKAVLPEEARARPPPPRSPPVLTGHVSSLAPY